MIAKGNKALAAEMKARDERDRADRQVVAAEAKVPSAAETQMEKDRAGYFAWRDKGDFRTPPPSLIGLNYGPEAAARREREQTAIPAGLLGMGAANADPTAIALSKQNLADENAEQDANAYQSAISGEDLFQRTGNSQSLMAQDFARKMGLLGDSSNMTRFSTQARIDTQPQSMLPMLLSGLIGGAASFATGGLSSMIPKPSDSRLKDRIQRLDGVHAVVFEWNEDARAYGLEPGEKAVGLLADEVEQVLPQFVSPIGRHRGIDYMGLSAYLLELIKELNTERNAATA